MLDMANEVIRLEKRRVNKGGLVLLILVLLCCLAAGGYYLYKNPDTLAQIFGDENSKVVEKKDKEGNVVVSSNALQKIDMKDTIIYGTSDFVLSIVKVENSSSGYSVTVKEEVKNGYIKSIKIRCDEVLVDGFSTGAGFDIEADVQNESTTTFLIKKTTMAELSMLQFDRLTFFLKVDYVSKETGDVEEGKTLTYSNTVTTSNIKKADNAQAGLLFIDEVDDVEIDFYRLLTDKDNYYFYFIFNNKSRTDNYNVQVKKFKVNGEVFNYTDLDLSLHYFSKKLFYLKVPKKSFDKVENFNVSFFLIKDRSRDGLDDAIYISYSNDIKV